MRVFVIGGTGAVGRHAVPAIIKAGDAVTALARSAENADWLREQGAKPIGVSIFDRQALRRVFTGHDAVVNLATSIPPMTRFLFTRAWQANDRIRVEGSAAVVQAALDVGVGRVLQESVSMVYPDRGADWVNEDVPADRFPLARANLAAEANTQRFSDAGRVGVVLRFGWFYGPGARHSEQLLKLARAGIAIVLGQPEGYISSIHMVDAGSAVAAALRVASGTYNVVDDEPLTKRSYAAAMSAAAGRAAWLRGPGRAALLLGDRLTSLTRSLRVSNARFRTAAGWAPRYSDARTGWLATAETLHPSWR